MTTQRGAGNEGGEQSSPSLLDERVPRETRLHWSYFTDEQVVGKFFNEVMDPWTDWHDPYHWAMLERVAKLVDKLQHA
jgi:hypothetical protein